MNYEFMIFALFVSPLVLNSTDLILFLFPSVVGVENLLFAFLFGNVERNPAFCC